MSALLSGATTGQVLRRGQAVVRRPRARRELVAASACRRCSSRARPTRCSRRRRRSATTSCCAQAGVPLKMMWFCGGHGVCLTGGARRARSSETVIAWMDRHLAGDASVDTGPALRVGRRRRRLALGRPLPAPARAAADRRGEGHARARRPPTRVSGDADHRRARRSTTVVNVAHPRRPRRAVDVVGEPTRRRCATAAPPSTRPAPRVRADRRPQAQRRARQPGDADPADAGRPAAHGDAGRSRASRRAPARTRATRSSSPAGRRCTGPTRNAGTVDVAQRADRAARRAAPAAAGPAAAAGIGRACRSTRRFTLKLSRQVQAGEGLGRRASG